VKPRAYCGRRLTGDVGSSLLNGRSNSVIRPFPFLAIDLHSPSQSLRASLRAFNLLEVLINRVLEFVIPDVNARLLTDT
jgi:hypothetical protein